MGILNSIGSFVVASIGGATRFMSALKTAFQSLKIGVPGVWLLFLYGVFGMLVLFSLSAYQLQFTIKSTTTPEGKPIALWQVLQIHSDWKGLKSESAILERSIADRAEKIRTETQELNELQLHREQHALDCAGQVASLRTYLWQMQVPNIKNADSLNKCNQDALNELKHAVTDSLQGALDRTDAKFTGLVATISEAVGKQEKSDTDMRHRQLRLDKEGEAIISEQAIVKTYRGQIRELLTSNALGVDTGDYLNSLSYFESKENLPLIPSFSAMPPDMLTLILVMAMGALGGTITLTRNYLRKNSGNQASGDTHGPASYLFRPLLGAITALAIFILAKAGVLIIATPSPGGGASLSPFFISFLGIVSGLLADNALDTIQRTGSKWFANAADVDRERWAHGLKRAIDHADAEGQQHSQQALAEVLGVTAKTLQDWIDEKSAVPSRQQALIAAYLHKPLRELFSDIDSTRQLQPAGVGSPQAADRDD